MQFNKNIETLVEEICRQVVGMIEMVSEVLDKTVTSICESNVELAEEIIEHDKVVNAMMSDIEGACIKIIATQQPVAMDLRTLISCMRMAYELERIGDHNVHVAKNVLRYREGLNTRHFSNIDKTLNCLKEMLKNVITAFSNKDAELARKTAEMDNRIDSLHRETTHNILSFMVDKGINTEESIGLLFIDRFFERMGDHITNICEWIIFTVTCERDSLDSNEGWHRGQFL